mgnify:CR=1 FL=1
MNLFSMFALEYVVDEQHYWHFSPTKDRLEEKLQECKDNEQNTQFVEIHAQQFASVQNLCNFLNFHVAETDLFEEFLPKLVKAREE